MSEPLFRPFRLRGLSLANRIVMAPMTRNFAAGGLPGPANAAYYRRRAEGGVGLILSEGTVIDRPSARNEPGIPFFHGAALAGWQGVIDAVHSAGGRMGPQLWHTGAMEGAMGWDQGGPVESPSGLIAAGRPRGQAMSETDIADVIAGFARAGTDARRLGFDLVELHGAHGYLLDAFFWAGSNRRTDRWGGPTIRERTRMAVEVIRAVRAAVGPEFPILFRVSQWKLQDYEARIATTPAEMTEWLEPLVDAGVDILHCSQRRFWEPEFPEIDGAEGLNFAGWAKRLTGVPTISVGSVGLSGDFLATFAGESHAAAGIGALAERMDRGEFDLIAVGRALLGDADWVEKLRQGDFAAMRGFERSQLARLD